MLSYYLYSMNHNKLSIYLSCCRPTGTRTMCSTSVRAWAAPTICAVRLPWPALRGRPPPGPSSSPPSGAATLLALALNSPRRSSPVVITHHSQILIRVTLDAVPRPICRSQPMDSYKKLAVPRVPELSVGTTTQIIRHSVS